MIAILGIIVGGIVIAIYLPIFDLIGKLSQACSARIRRKWPGSSACAPW
jgi:hypothetical protein